MRVRIELRRTLQWVLDQQEPFYGVEMAKELEISQNAARKSLHRLQAMSLIDSLHLEVKKVHYIVADRDKCEIMAAWRPKVANGYVPVKKRPVKRIINSVWSLGA